MDLGLADRVVIVTGASRGIGRAIAQALSAEGMKLVLAARSEEAMQESQRKAAAQVIAVLNGDQPEYVVKQT